MLELIRDPTFLAFANRSQQQFGPRGIRFTKVFAQLFERPLKPAIPHLNRFLSRRQIGSGWRISGSFRGSRLCMRRTNE